MISGYKYIQAFSIDVSLGGVACAIFAYKYLGISPDTFLLIELGLAIWIIYTFDHLLDAGSGKYNPITFRHKLHKKHSIFIWGVWSFLLIVAFSLLFKLPYRVIVAGGALAFIVVLYFISLRILDSKKVFHKEFSASLIYGIGIFLGPMTLFEGTPGIDFWILLAEFIMIALANLLIFSMYELNIDQVSGFQSFVKSTSFDVGRKTIILLITLLFVSSMMSMIVFYGSSSIFIAQFLILIMAIVLSLLLIFKNKLIINERFRFVGDIIFFIPLIYLLF